MNAGLLAEKGHHIFPATVPGEMCDAVVKDILNHTEGGRVGVDGMGMVEMYHYQSMWDVRQHPPLYEAFKLMLGVDRLWVSIDRCSYKLPSDGVKDEGFIHWDANVNEWPRPVGVQGVVALTDTTEEMGGFQCVPSLYRELDDWLALQPTGKAIFPYFYVHEGRTYEVRASGWEEYAKGDRRSWPIEKVPMGKGDLLIWDSFLPHGNGVNRGDRPRLAQYVSMGAVGDERTRTERVWHYAEGQPPSGWAFPGDPRNIERFRRLASLTPLGMRLLGQEKWED